MTVPEVYFSSLKSKSTISPLNKIKKLLNKCRISDTFQKDELIAVKVHFGELGNTAFVRPVFLRPVIEALKRIGAKPFLADTNTLYVGMRTNSVDHLHNAFLNGFNFSTLQTPVIIADGLRGENSLLIEVNLKLLDNVRLASSIVNADGMVVVSHFKGHEVSGFGGAIKSLSMGCASREGKLEMHSVTRPKVNPKKCTECERCKINCSSDAIEMSPKAYITDRCVGCARCIAVCPEGAVNINWDESSENTQKKMVEYAYGVVKSLESKIIYLNILTSISPACDCYPGNDEPITRDIGFLASLDPVAIDRASWNLVVNSVEPIEDPFKKLYDYLDPEVQFRHAGAIGFGSNKYKLVKID